MQAKVPAVPIVLILLAACATTEPVVSPTTSLPPEIVTTGPSATTTTSSPITTIAEAENPTVSFDGDRCELSGPTQLSEGLATVYLLNTSPNPAEAIFGKAQVGYGIDEIAVDVESGRFDSYGLADWDKPSGFTSTPARMPQNSTEPIRQSFKADPGTLIVICLDTLKGRAYLATAVFEVSG